MSTQIQTRRGTTAQHSSFTGAAGEVTVDTDKNVVVVHDGSTAGGHEAVSVGSNPTFTSTVQTTERTITAGAFDLSTGNNWTCGTIAIPNPTNAVASTSGLIRLTAAPTSWGANFKHPGGTTIAPASFPALVPYYVQTSSVILLGNPVEGIA